jgi:hypothetical protein
MLAHAMAKHSSRTLVRSVGAHYLPQKYAISEEAPVRYLELGGSPTLVRTPADFGPARELVQTINAVRPQTLDPVADAQTQFRENPRAARRGWGSIEILARTLADRPEYLAKQVENMLFGSLALLRRGHLSDGAIVIFNQSFPRADRALRMELRRERDHTAAVAQRPRGQLVYLEGPSLTRQQALQQASREIAQVFSRGKRYQEMPSPFQWDSEHEHPLVLLWDVVRRGLLRRIKLCPQCDRWFVDERRNALAVRCSVECTNRWWNRSRRRAANHKVNTKTRRRRR